MITVRDLMTNNPLTVAPEVHLRHVLATMNNSGCRHLPVMQEERLVGIITERDLRLAVNSPVLGLNTADTADVLEDFTVAQCMSPDPLTTSPDTPAKDVADILRLQKYGALPVVEAGKLVGIISVIDFLNYFSQMN